MTRKFRAPRVSAAYAALLVEALDAGGCLILADDRPGGSEAFRQRLLRANVLAQLDLMQLAPEPTRHPEGGHVFALTASGEILARATVRTPDDRPDIPRR